MECALIAQRPAGVCQLLHVRYPTIHFRIGLIETNCNCWDRRSYKTDLVLAELDEPACTAPSAFPNPKAIPQQDEGKKGCISHVHVSFDLQRRCRGWGLCPSFTYVIMSSVKDFRTEGPLGPTRALNMVKLQSREIVV